MASEKGIFMRRQRKVFFFVVVVVVVVVLELSENGLGRVSQFFVQTLVLIS